MSSPPKTLKEYLSSNPPPEEAIAVGLTVGLLARMPGEGFSFERQEIKAVISGQKALPSPETKAYLRSYQILDGDDKLSEIGVRIAPIVLRLSSPPHVSE